MVKRIAFLALLFWLLPVVGRCQAIDPIHTTKGDNVTITRSLQLLVTQDAVEVATVSVNGQVTYIAPDLAKVCNKTRLERNLIAAANGSEKALRYINKCLARMPKKSAIFSLPPPAECAGQYLRADSQGRLRWTPPCKERR